MKSFSCARLFVTPWIVDCTKLLHPWDFQGKSTGVGCHFLLQENQRFTLKKLFHFFWLFYFCCWGFLLLFLVLEDGGMSKSHLEFIGLWERKKRRKIKEITSTIKPKTTFSFSIKKLSSSRHMCFENLQGEVIKPNIGETKWLVSFKHL